MLASVRFIPSMSVRECLELLPSAHGANRRGGAMMGRIDTRHHRQQANNIGLNSGE